LGWTSAPTKVLMLRAESEQAGIHRFFYKDRKWPRYPSGAAAAARFGGFEYVESARSRQDYTIQMRPVLGTLELCGIWLTA
jgi:hypothetical protein